MSDFLSQDQIDALLQQQSAGGFDIDDVDDGSDSSSDMSSGSGPDFDALKEAFELFSEQASTVISTLLNKEVAFSVSECGDMNEDTMKGAMEAPVLAIKIPLEGGVNGQLNVVMSTKEIAILSDLMMMGDGTAEYTEDHKDAISEIFNQIIGSFTTALGDKVGESVSSGTIEVSEYDFSEPFSDSHMVIEGLNIEEIGDSSFAIAVSESLSSDFQAKFGTVDEGADLGFDDGGDIGLSSSELDDLSDMSMGGGDSTDLSAFGTSGTAHNINAPQENINMLLDVPLDVSIELGKTDLSIKRILELAPGAVVELDRMAGEPVDLLVNDKVVAKGEVVVVDENFGIRIVSLVSPEERIKSLA